MTRRTSYDPACGTLAEHFLQDLPALSVDALAAHIQHSIEEWIEDQRTARQPLPQPEQRGVLFTDQQWRHLPIALRRRWWDETELGRKPPSDELKTEIEHAIKGESK